MEPSRGARRSPRRRIKQACDKCSKSRQRCDGRCPCMRCEEYGYTCQYNRQTKKRGRVSGKVAAAAQKPSQYDPVHNGGPEEDAQLARPCDPTESRRDGQQYEGTASNGSRVNQNDQRALTDLPTPVHHASVGEMDSMLDTYPGPGPIRRGRNTLQHILSPTVQTSEEGPTVGAGSPHTLTGSHGPAIDRLYNGVGTHGSSNGGTYSSEAVVRDSDEGLREMPAMSISVTSEPGNRMSLNGDDIPQTSGYPYKCLEPIVSDLKGILPLSAACGLLEVYFAEPCGSLFNGASPFVLTHVLRKRSVLHPTKPRQTTPALLATMLWCTAQTADLRIFHTPGARRRISDRLHQLSISLLRPRDPDNWHRTPEGWRFESDSISGQATNAFTEPPKTIDDRPPGTLDEVLAFTLMTIAVSAGEFKADSLKWWGKSIRLAKQLRLDTEDDKSKYTLPTHTNHSPQSWPWEDGNSPQNQFETKEERRRMFWLVYCLDRHLALSFNTPLSVLDTNCQVYSPLPEEIWENLEFADINTLSSRVYGPPMKVSGTGFFEFFLPLMAILGDIIEAHQRYQHPRFGGIQDEREIAFIEEMLDECGKALKEMELQNSASDSSGAPYMQTSVEDEGLTRSDLQAFDMINSSKMTQKSKERARVNLVIAYSNHILNVLYVLHHGKWDAISMIDDKDDWITSARFVKCGSHAISACQAVSHILRFDPEMTFMPYLFGIYLLHGSFILLLFADRMPQLGPNESVEGVCETIIRAHEVCVVTLSTEFQKNFRKVLRSALYNAWSPSSTSWEEHEERRRELLSLYRWTRGARGLAL